MLNPTQTTRIKADINPQDRAKTRLYHTPQGMATVTFTTRGGALVRMPDGRTVVLNASDVAKLAR